MVISVKNPRYAQCNLDKRLCRFRWLIGALSTRGGQKLSGKKRHPTIRDNVTIYAGASILGGDTEIGENSVIGGNTFITSSVPANTRVSMKNPEMEYRTHDKVVREEMKQSDDWFYII